MDIRSQLFDLPLDDSRSPVLILEGDLDAYSTEALHHHGCHQILRIRSGITLLVEGCCKQPLFSNMTAFIPAGLPHRSVVLGSPVTYKSIYLQGSMLRSDIEEIVIFDMSDLGIALFDRIGSRIETDGADVQHLDHQCLRLLLALLETELVHRSSLVRLPVPRHPDNLKITDHIARSFSSKMKLADFTNVLHYSERHLSRMFKDDVSITIFEYLRLYRIFQASLMLNNRAAAKTVTETALPADTTRSHRFTRISGKSLP